MKAAVLRGFGQPFSIEDVSLRDPGAHEVRVEIRACAVCHSDVTLAEGGWGGEPPMVLGHEAAGVVTKVGEHVTGVAEGDHAVVTLIRSCGACACCEDDLEVLCAETFGLDEASPLSAADGSPIAQGLRTGAFAEAVTVHESQVCAVPASVPFEAASLLACGVVTGFGAVTNTAGMKPGQSAVVVGCGGVGLNALQGARAAGCDPIVAVDPSEDKRAQALRFGATHSAHPDEAKDLVASLTARGADGVFVAVGHADVLSEALVNVAPGGQLVVVGMPVSGAMSSYEGSWLAGLGQRIVGSKMGSAVVRRDIPHLVSLYEKGELLLDELVARTWSLDEIDEAFAAARQGVGARQVIALG